jgi:hypothetical protein
VREREENVTIETTKEAKDRAWILEERNGVRRYGKAGLSQESDTGARSSSRNTSSRKKATRRRIGKGMELIMSKRKRI